MIISRKYILKIISLITCMIMIFSVLDFSVLFATADSINKIYTDTNYLSFGTVNQYDRVYYQTVNVYNYNDTEYDLMWYVSDPNNILYVDAPDSMHLNPDGETQFYISCYSDINPGSYSAEIYICDRNDTSCTYGSCIRVSVTIKGATPYISSVSVSPKNISLTRNSNVNFSASVSGGYDYSRDVIWSITGSNGSSSIDSNGNLSIGSNENASMIKVRATSRMDSNYFDEATVNITKNTYSITASSEPSNAGAVSGGGTVNQGDGVYLVASPYSGYQFVRWKQNGNEISTSTKLYIGNINTNANYVAEFKQVKCKLNIESNHSYGGNVSGETSVAYGGEATITATANPGYRFDGWYENNNKISSDAKYKLTNITSDRKITAVFNPNEYNVSIQQSPQDGGSVKGAGKYSQGSAVYLKATPKTGYTFSGWFLNGNEYSKNSEISISSISQDYSFVAYFMKNGATTYNVVSSTASSDGTISPEGNYFVPQGNSVTYAISPKSGYEIADVKVDNVSVGAVSSYTFTNVNNQHNIVAYFKTKPQPVNQNNSSTNSSGTGNNSTNINNGVNNNVNSNSGTDQVSNDNSLQNRDVITNNTQATNGTDYQRNATDYNIDDETGIMQKYNVNDAEVINMIRNNQGKEMFERAIDEGTFEISVFNELGNFVGEVQSIADADVSITNLNEVIGGMLTDDDLLQILHSKKVAISINLFDSTNNVSELDKKYINSSLFGGMKIEKYFDVVILKTVDGDTTEVTRLNTPMTMVINVPDEFKGKNRSFYIVRTHTEDGITSTDILTDEDMNPDTITFTSDKFSTYALIYIDSYSAGNNTAPAAQGNSKQYNDKLKGISVLVGAVVGLIVVLGAANIIVAAGRRNKKK